ncbi:MAG TPA: hypothetical protein VL285_17760 [Bryobacteraceae bacterium]|nr:hypothetical protein [Bryobacteraceae bacterium]
MTPLALILLAAAAGWVPARWNSSDPKSLDALKGGAVNCVLVESSHWDPTFIKTAGRYGIAVLGLVQPGKGAEEKARRASQLGLDGLAVEGDFDQPDLKRIRAAGGSLILVELPARGAIRLDSRDPVVGTWQGLWPGIVIEHGGGAATAGPTSTPWINTNTGFLRFARAATAAAVWVGERPPPGSVFPTARYELSVADAAMAGARWIIALDSDLERRLLSGDKAARTAWKRIDAQVRYWQNPDWREYRPYSELALVQDAGSGGLLSGSILDLLSVLHTAARPAPTRRLNPGSLQGARVVLNLDAESVTPAQRADLEQFTRAGGRVVNPPKGWRFPEVAADQTTPTRRQLDQIQPIWESTYEATARKNFGVRTFNTASVLFNLMQAPDGRSLLVHLLNYADYPAEDVTVQALGKWRRARLYSPDGEARDLPVYPVTDGGREGTGVDIARIRVAATLRLD